jgi:peptidoglycan/xylan/chitin deacetylase (PgdA/CDA1 family)
VRTAKYYPPRGRDAILVYHSIGSVPRSSPGWNGFITPERFAAQMAFLAEHRRPVTLDELLAHPAGGGPPRVAITFDDGYRSALEHAVPVLRAHGLPATFFVPTKWIGEANTWDPPAGAPRDVMTADELAQLDRDGFAVESHGHAHLHYARDQTDPAAAVDDVRQAHEALRHLLGRDPRYLAYPFGRATPETAAEAQRLGLRAAFTLDHPQELQGAFAVRRTPVVPADAGPMFALKSAGLYIGWRQSRPVRGAYRAVRPLVRNRWLWPG